MEDTTPIDYSAVVHQLQLENEMLRSSMKTFVEVRDAVYSVPELLRELWGKSTANKTRLLIGLMILYWAISIAFLLVDRLKGW